MSDKTPSVKIEAPADLAAPVASFARLTRDLTELLSRENALLETRRPSELEALQGEKTRLTAEYRKALGVLRVNEAQMLGAKDSPARAYIKALTDAMRAELTRHAKLVLRLKTVTEGIIRSIGDDVAKHNRTVQGYGNNAAMQPVKGARPTSIALNTTI